MKNPIVFLFIFILIAAFADVRPVSADFYYVEAKGAEWNGTDEIWLSRIWLGYETKKKQPEIRVRMNRMSHGEADLVVCTLDNDGHLLEVQKKSLKDDWTTFVMEISWAFRIHVLVWEGTEMVPLGEKNEFIRSSSSWINVKFVGEPR